ncbi:MAG: V-type ATP synthase subunit E [Spirochaetales bacterium]|jgi:V/A-type H+-transporting ATPase subunit E|nr:V-type ATP synthase subunit E [Spirochaetales bacterium]
MDIQLHELIEKIKKDGIQSASEEASKLKSQAEAEAKRIVEAAKKEADDITARAKTDAERTEKAGIAAVGQASRNLVLDFKSKIQGLLDAIVAKDAAAAYDENTLKSLLPEIVKNWAAKGDDLALILPEADLKKLEGSLKEKLSAELKKGIELKGDRGLEAGFRIANKDGSAYYDFSAESVAELLSAYLNPRLAETLKSAVKEG